MLRWILVLLDPHFKIGVGTKLLRTNFTQSWHPMFDEGHDVNQQDVMKPSHCCWWRRRGGWGRTLPNSWWHSGGRIAFTSPCRLVKLASSSSEFTDPSSSEQSCDTVIFVGSRDDEGTDLEHPPVFLPGLNSGDNRGQMAKVLRGTSAEFKSSSLERQHKQRRSSKSPSSSQNGLRICSPVHMPQPNKLRPGSVGSTPTHSWKMNRMNLKEDHTYNGTEWPPKNITWWILTTFLVFVFSSKWLKWGHNRDNSY